MVEKTLNLGDILQAVTTIIASLIITVVFTKRQTKRNRTNDLMVGWLTDTITLTDVFDDVDAGVKYASVMTTLMKIRGKLNTLKEMSRYSSLEELPPNVERMLQQLTTIRHLLTDTPAHGDTQDPSTVATVDEDILKLGSSRFAELDKALLKFRSGLFEIQLAINNSD